MLGAVLSNGWLLAGSLLTALTIAPISNALAPRRAGIMSRLLAVLGLFAGLYLIAYGLLMVSTWDGWDLALRPDAPPQAQTGRGRVFTWMLALWPIFTVGIGLASCLIAWRLWQRWKPA